MMDVTTTVTSDQPTIERLPLPKGGNNGEALPSDEVKSRPAPVFAPTREAPSPGDDAPDMTKGIAPSASSLANDNMLPGISTAVSADDSPEETTFAPRVSNSPVVAGDVHQPSSASSNTAAIRSESGAPHPNANNNDTSSILSSLASEDSVMDKSYPTGGSVASCGGQISPPKAHHGTMHHTTVAETETAVAPKYTMPEDHLSLSMMGRNMMNNIYGVPTSSAAPFIVNNAENNLSMLDRTMMRHTHGIPTTTAAAAPSLEANAEKKTEQAVSQAKKHEAEEAKLLEETEPPKKKKKKKKAKDPNAPAGPKTAWNFFYSSSGACDTVKKANPDLTHGEVTKVVATDWKAMSDEKKAVWNRMAADDEARYQREMDAYKNNDFVAPPPPAKPKSAYVLYAASGRTTVREASPDLTFGEVTKVVAADWNAMSDENKAVWNRMAADDKARYQREMDAYKGSELEAQKLPSLEENERKMQLQEVEDAVNDERETYLLATAKDSEYLSDRQCYVRSHLLEIFVTNKAHVLADATTSRGGLKVNENQIGLRCAFCVKLQPKDRAERAVCYPSSISQIYRRVADMQRFHFENCAAIPPQVLATYKSLKTTRPNYPVSRGYWEESARDIGLVDSSRGIKIGEDGGMEQLLMQKKVETGLLEESSATNVQRLAPSPSPGNVASPGILHSPHPLPSDEVKSSPAPVFAPTREAPSLGDCAPPDMTTNGYAQSASSLVPGLSNVVSAEDSPSLQEQFVPHVSNSPIEADDVHQPSATPNTAAISESGTPHQNAKNDTSSICSTLTTVAEKKAAVDPKSTMPEGHSHSMTERAKTFTHGGSTASALPVEANAENKAEETLVARDGRCASHAHGASTKKKCNMAAAQAKKREVEEVAGEEVTEPPKKKQKEKKARDPNAPAWPKTGYMFYSQWCSTAVKEAYPDLTVEEVTNVVAANWNALSIENKAVWNRMVWLQMIKRLGREMDAYKTQNFIAPNEAKLLEEAVLNTEEMEVVVESPQHAARMTSSSLNQRGTSSPPQEYPPPGVSNALAEADDAHQPLKDKAKAQRDELPLVHGPTKQGDNYGQRGVTIRPSGKWQVQYYYCGESRYIGVFDSKEIAHAAYETAREILGKETSFNLEDKEAINARINVAREAVGKKKISKKKEAKRKRVAKKKTSGSSSSYAVNDERETYLLATANDSEYLSDRQCYIRSHLLEIFVTNKADMAARHSQGGLKVNENQIGLRCAYCVNLNPQDRAKNAVCYPSNISHIYERVANMQRFHFENCAAIPPQVLATYKSLKTTRTRPNYPVSTRDYWEESARDIGLVDSSRGIKIDEDGGMEQLLMQKKVETGLLEESAATTVQRHAQQDEKDTSDYKDGSTSSSLPLLQVLEKGKDAILSKKGAIESSHQEENESPQRPKRSKKVARDPNAPKYPRTAYTLYSTSFVARIAAEEAYPDLTSDGMTKAIAANWDAMSDESKAAWNHMAADDEERYQWEMDAYKGSELEAQWLASVEENQLKMEREAAEEAAKSCSGGLYTMRELTEAGKHSSCSKSGIEVERCQISQSLWIADDEHGSEV